jgi:SAM-dependent methyltransferase
MAALTLHRPAALGTIWALVSDADAFNAFEAAGWETHAAGYEEFFGPITTRLVEPLLDAAGVRPGARVLDVASGPGYVAARAAERGASVVGVDIAEAMISLARRLHPQLEFRHGSAEALPLRDESFDAALGNFVVLHLGRPEQAAAELARVLVPGGRVALTVWDLPDRARFIGVFLDAVAAAGATPPEDLPVGPPFFRFSPRSRSSSASSVIRDSRTCT